MDQRVSAKADRPEMAEKPLCLQGNNFSIDIRFLSLVDSRSRTNSLNLVEPMTTEMPNAPKNWVASGSCNAKEKSIRQKVVNQWRKSSKQHNDSDIVGYDG
jgi:hypothetical protein